MKLFERSDEYQTKVFVDALDNDVRFDAQLVCVAHGRKLKVYCEDTGTYVQFPTSIRRIGRRFIADVVKSRRTNGNIFYRAYRSSIRDAETGEVVS